MQTSHRIFYNNSKFLNSIDAETADMVVTSPPYPMIEMWDELFFNLNPEIRQALTNHDPVKTCELMHRELDPVWEAVFRVLKPGGTVCINIGDATRTINGHFALYTNHARITSRMQALGFSSLPAIIWRKQTNAPNKFMGSGMFPPGAYVTLEHEYILIFRKGSKMIFPDEASKNNRRESAYFWEERNQWFSDVWMDLKGASQNMKNHTARLRSGAFPFELPYRLINMFSVKGSTILDPFLGMGTSTMAAIASGRNSIGFEINSAFRETIDRDLLSIAAAANRRLEERLDRHHAFVQKKEEEGYSFKHTNDHYGFPVMTRQEKTLLLNDVLSVTQVGDDAFEAAYSPNPQKAHCRG